MANTSPEHVAEASSSADKLRYGGYDRFTLELEVRHQSTIAHAGVPY